ncbi:MAG: CaiB/BaiF CoA-transferase family protein [Zoogloea sp.]|uniref:CaiB/BaiF CoA transferase family protein n=1 Tax=Zoogloea sp. TaxID=49181 RepID=UPI00263870E5|nr:CaiB/BaiF CoA-transferase family protein [Zoogloea sp.]MDD2991535.1 CaiB/BaiF CoA-transferase family protein [Zoogloea sp.]
MGPLHGVKVIEFAALGPCPMAAMILADLGAEVVRIERKPAPGAKPASDLFDPKIDILNRSRRVVTLDLKKPEGLAAAKQLVAGADILVEGYRPGVMERIGLGPDTCLEANPRLVYGRMTGWGQTGPLAQAAGHDINYLSLSGALHAIGEPGGKPVVPLNLVADCGGGAMLLVVGVLAALTEARTSGQGQVVDAAMTDGSALLMTMMYTLKAMGQWTQQRGSNLLDGGAHFYDTYRCADGKYISIGPIEPQFYALFLQKTGLGDPDFSQQWDRARWPELKARLAAHLETRPRDQWCALLEGTDACVAPVLDMDEAPEHPHNRARGTFIEVGGVTQPAPAPRFSRSIPAQPRPPVAGVTGDDVLADWGFTPDDINRLRTAGAV